MKAVGKGLLIVLSGPSGVGKTTLCERLLQDCPGMVRSLTCTTRAPRGNEVDGQDYFFLTDCEFDRRLAAGQLLEHAVVHGHKYGTPRGLVEDLLRQGKDVLLAIDVQGAAQVRDCVAVKAGSCALKANLVDIFILPPSIEVLRERLAKRNEDSEEVVRVRLANAVKEMESAGCFKYSVVNDSIDRAVKEVKSLLERERSHGRGKVNE